MKTIAILIALCLSASNAFAADSCDTQAQAKKLAGAAKTSFTKKCVADATTAAQASCDSAAATKKLAGAAKASFTKKCVSDALKG